MSKFKLINILNRSQITNADKAVVDISKYQHSENKKGFVETTDFVENSDLKSENGSIEKSELAAQDNFIEKLDLQGMDGFVENSDAKLKPIFVEQEELENKHGSENVFFEQAVSSLNIADQYAFDIQYEQYWQEACVNDELLSVLLCEIDFLHAFYHNTSLQDSTDMLCNIAQLLCQHSAEFGGYLARHGENKFVVLIKGGDINATHQAAETLRAAVEQSSIQHEFSDISDVATLTIGVSTAYPSSPASVVKHSIAALAHGKVAGHNQIFLASELVKQPNLSIDSSEEEQNYTPSKTEFERLMSDMSIPNRGDFNRHFMRTWKEAVHEEDLLAMVICEIDFFDEYKAFYKQQTCDDIVLLIACALKNTCDQFGAFVAHLEGEKFVAYLKGGNATKGWKVAEALHTVVQDLAIEHPFSPLKNSITMSFGLSNIFPTTDTSMKVLMINAKKGLIDAQSKGYNQIGVFE